jgi:hypothetical protein
MRGGSLTIKPGTTSSNSETGRTGATPRRALASALLAAPFLLPLAVSRAEEMGGDRRLIGRFIEDGAIVQKAWIEAAAAYDDFSGGRDLSGFTTFAFRFGRDVEAGVVAGVLDRRREAGETLYGSTLAGSFETTGLADATIYGKYRVIRSPIELAVGAAVTVAVTDASRGLSPGNEQARGFVGLRRTLERVTLVGSAGVTDRSDSRAPGDSPGRVSTRLGTGIIIPISYDWAILGEVDFNGARYVGEGPDSRLLAGIDWRPTANTVLRGAVGKGLSDAAPRTSTVLSGVFHF